jgi:hypothetical protein
MAHGRGRPRAGADPRWRKAPLASRRWGVAKKQPERRRGAMFTGGKPPLPPGGGGLLKSNQKEREEPCSREASPPCLPEVGGC